MWPRSTQYTHVLQKDEHESITAHHTKNNNRHRNTYSEFRVWQDKWENTSWITHSYFDTNCDLK